ncbi:TPA: hypothetical protein ACYZXV_001628 [Escherichia coli]
MKKANLTGTLVCFVACIIFLSSSDIFREKPIALIWFIRQNTLFFTGTLAWCLMTLTMCLSLRSSWLNKVLAVWIKHGDYISGQEYAPSLLLSPTGWMKNYPSYSSPLAGLLTLVKSLILT